MHHFAGSEAVADDRSYVKTERFPAELRKAEPIILLKLYALASLPAIQLHKELSDPRAFFTKFSGDLIKAPSSAIGGHGSAC
jgi:hypothetical protein